MVEVDAGGVKGVLLDRTVRKSVDVLLAKLTERRFLVDRQFRICRWLAVMQDEIGNAATTGDLDSPLFQQVQKIFCIGLPATRVCSADLPNADGVAFAGEDELAVPRLGLFLHGSHAITPRNAAAMRTKRLQQKCRRSIG